MEAEADLDRVLVIDEAKRELTLSDERIEKAITQNGARLIILDPIQAYMGEKTDMNRANEVRPMFRRLADVAERTGCAVILIGHLQQSWAGGAGTPRGWGFDFPPRRGGGPPVRRREGAPSVRVRLPDTSFLPPGGGAARAPGVRFSSPSPRGNLRLGGWVKGGPVSSFPPFPVAFALTRKRAFRG